MHRDRPRCYEKHYCALKGIIRCTDCSTVVTWQLQKDRYYGACRRDSDGCKQGKLLREDAVEDMLVDMLQKLVCPSPEITDWVADAMRSQYRESIENREKLLTTIQSQIDRITRMDESLYDDKLSGEITKGKYEEKHEEFVNEKVEHNDRLSKLDASQSKRLEQKLVILELSQKAAEIYRKKTPEQKRLILSKLFAELTLSSGLLSVSRTKFAQAIAEKVQETRKLMEEQK